MSGGSRVSVSVAARTGLPSHLRGGRYACLGFVLP